MIRTDREGIWLFWLSTIVPWSAQFCVLFWFWQNKDFLFWNDILTCQNRNFLFLSYQNQNKIVQLYPCFFDMHLMRLCFIVIAGEKTTYAISPQEELRWACRSFCCCARVCCCESFCRCAKACCCESFCCRAKACYCGSSYCHAKACCCESFCCCAKTCCCGSSYCHAKTCRCAKACPCTAGANCCHTTRVLVRFTLFSVSLSKPLQWC